MKIISVINQKGGVGKTSITGAIAAQEAFSGKKVLSLDCDDQGNLSSWILGDNPVEHELAEILLKQVEYSDAIVESDIPNLSILPTISLNGQLKLYSKTRANESPFAIRQLLKKISSANFDFVFIDCPPNFYALVESCMLASDEAIVVLDLTEFSKDGLIKLFSAITDMQERFDTDRPLMNKIILNKRDKRLLVQEDIINSLRSSLPEEFTFYTIPTDQSFPKAQILKAPIQTLKDTKKETLDVIKLIAEAF